jgi:opacity protein-like surface antigen
MKKSILLLLMLSLGFATPKAQAQEWYDDERCSIDWMNFYAKIFGGANFLQRTLIDGNRASYRTGYIISGSVGYYCLYGFRLEGEYAFRANDIHGIQFNTQGSSNNGHLHNSSFMANLYWDLPSCLWGYRFCYVEPYVGAGLGYDFYKMHSSNDLVIFDQNWRHLSWQAMVGVAYPICRNTDINLEYKFHDGGNHFFSHSLGIGVVLHW